MGVFSAMDSDDLQLHILASLAESPISDTRKLQLPRDITGNRPDESDASQAEDQLSIKGALDSLRGKEMVTYQTHNIEVHVLTTEGKDLASSGSHEYRVWEVLGEAGMSMAELQASLGAEGAKVGQGKAFRNKWIKKRSDGGFVRAMEANQIIDQTKLDLIAIETHGTLPNDDAKGTQIADYRKRKLCEKKKYMYFSADKGIKFATTIEKPETDLTADLLSSGLWQTAKFKPYNFNAVGMLPNGGALHPLMKVREEFRNIFFEMGFTEMPTDRYVESSFWCFDSLFVPQQHPARESQDTFYLKDPVVSTEFPEEYYKSVKKIHETGGHGSIGYRAPFQKSETEKLLLRTHTTSVSANMLYEIAQDCRKKGDGEFVPSKMFSIDRVFRNEAVDATHLAEFHQVEGVVADKNITLGDLIGFMKVFFAKMGIHDIRVKPTYNPYTEPSMEIYSWHEGLKKWVEIGNSGLFRPEMLEPMGIPPDVRVLGWGLSLERPTMIKYGISNIRELLGHKVSLASVQQAAAVRF
ncbi:tRNA synthetases class II core domain (F)-domain-containing protein [Melampsora americana]|nr:tRNA synthetases class II core domain (F)-domain-containing protein [Melampsora americana]